MNKLTTIVNALHLPPPTSTYTHQHTPTSTLPDDNESREHLIKSMLAKGRKAVKQLKTGIHNDVFYFGTVLQGDDEKDRTAVITSNKEIFVDFGRGKNEIKTGFGMFYRYDFEYDVLDNQLSTKAINKFLYGNYEAKSLKELFEAIRDLNKNYMWYPEDTSHDIVSLGIIATYYMACFEALGRTFLEAEKGSGKTRQCTIKKLLCFNSIMSADISKASFYRIMESSCGTLIIDDFDSINEEQKNDILQHYKTGYKNVSKSVRTGDNKSRKQDAFRTYGHVVMNNTMGLDDISSDRSYFLRLIKTEQAVTNTLLKEDAPFWRELSDDLYISALTHWKAVKEMYISLECSFNGRDNEVSRPLLAIAKLVSEDVYNTARVWFKENFENKKYVDLETDWKYLMWDYFVDKLEGSTHKLSLITEHIANKTLDMNDRDFEKRKRGISSWVGKQLNLFPTLVKKKTVMGVNYVDYLSKERLKSYFGVSGWKWVEVGGG